MPSAAHEHVAVEEAVGDDGHVQGEVVDLEIAVHPLFNIRAIAPWRKTLDQSSLHGQSLNSRIGFNNGHDRNGAHAIP